MSDETLQMIVRDLIGNDAEDWGANAILVSRHVDDLTATIINVVRQNSADPAPNNSDRVTIEDMITTDKRVPDGAIISSGANGLVVMLTKPGPAVIPWSLIRDLTARAAESIPPADSLDAAIKECEEKGQRWAVGMTRPGAPSPYSATVWNEIESSEWTCVEESLSDTPLDALRSAMQAAANQGQDEVSERTGT